MDRRKFLRNGTLTVGSWQFVVGSGQLAVDSIDSQINPQAPLMQKDAALELEEITVDELQQKMQSGEQTSVSITNAYLKRIEQIDRSGPMLNSIIELNPDALQMAAALDQERKQGKIRGPLHGIPILVKDNINTGDRMLTTAGSLAMEGNRAKEDAFVMKQLRKSGIVFWVKPI